MASPDPFAENFSLDDFDRVPIDALMMPKDGVMNDLNNFSLPDFFSLASPISPALPTLPTSPSPALLPLPLPGIPLMSLEQALRGLKIPLKELKEYLESDPSLLTRLESKFEPHSLLTQILVLNWTENEKLDFIKLLLDKNPELIRKRNAKGETPFIAATYAGHLEILKYLAERDPHSILFRTPEGVSILGCIQKAYFPDKKNITDFITSLYTKLVNEMQNERMTHFRQLMAPLNQNPCPFCNTSRGCSINCAWVSESLDDKLNTLYIKRETPDDHAPARYGQGALTYRVDAAKGRFEIAAESATHPSLERLTHSMESGYRLIPQQGASASQNTEHESKEKKDVQERFVIEIDATDQDFSHISKKYVGLCLAPNQIVAQIRKLPRRFDGTTQGYLFFMQKNMAGHGHVCNFFCDSEERGNFVYFLDAQKDPKDPLFISLTPDTRGWDTFGIVLTVSTLHLKPQSGISSTETTTTRVRPSPILNLGDALSAPDFEDFQGFLDTYPHAIKEISKTPTCDTAATYLLSLHEKQLNEDQIIEKMTLLLKRHPELLTMANGYSLSPVSMAAMKGLTKVLNFLLPHLKCSAIPLDNQFRNPLMLTLEFGQGNTPTTFSCIQSLIDAHPCMLEHRTHQGETVLDFVPKNLTLPQMAMLDFLKQQMTLKNKKPAAMPYSTGYYASPAAPQRVPQQMPVAPQQNESLPWPPGAIPASVYQMPQYAQLPLLPATEILPSIETASQFVSVPQQLPMSPQKADLFFLLPSAVTTSMQIPGSPQQPSAAAALLDPDGTESKSSAELLQSLRRQLEASREETALLKRKNKSTQTRYTRMVNIKDKQINAKDAEILELRKQLAHSQQERKVFNDTPAPMDQRETTSKKRGFAQLETSTPGLAIPSDLGRMRDDNPAPLVRPRRFPPADSPAVAIPGEFAPTASEDMSARTRNNVDQSAAAGSGFTAGAGMGAAGSGSGVAAPSFMPSYMQSQKRPSAARAVAQQEIFDFRAPERSLHWSQ